MSSAHHGSRGTGLDALRIADFRFYFATRLCVALMSSMTAVGVGWQVYDLARQNHSVERSAFYVGMVGLTHFLAVAATSLVAGDAADRHDRRKVIRWALLGEALALALLLAITLAGTRSVWLLILVAGLAGVGRATLGPAMQALAPSLVPAAVLPSAIAISSMAWQGAAVIGPALCGVLIARNIALVYGTGLVLALLALLLSLFIAAPREDDRRRLAGHPLRAVREGLVFIRSHKMVLGAISLDLFAVLLGSATAMLPVYARDILMVGPEGLGWLRAAPAVGAAAVAVLLALRPLQRRTGPAMFVCVGVFGMATILFGLSRSFPLSLACLALLGAADLVSVYVRVSLIQIYTPDAMRGRVSSVSTMFISASNELGEFQSGLAASLIGAVPSVVFGGAGALLVTLLWARWFPELRRIDRLVPAEKAG